jgi:hypothetical protein
MLSWLHRRQRALEVSGKDRPAFCAAVLRFQRWLAGVRSNIAPLRFGRNASDAILDAKSLSAISCRAAPVALGRRYANVTG